MSRIRIPVPFLAACICVLTGVMPTYGQMGGGGGGMPPSGGPSLDKPKFYERVLEEGGPRLRQEESGKLVVDVRFEGLQVVPESRVISRVKTRIDRNFSQEQVMEDVRKLHGMEYFSHVTHRIEEVPEGVIVTFIVRERPIIKSVIFHGNRAMNERELKGRAGIQAGDPLSEMGIESARRRLVAYYHEEGFLDASISVVKGTENHPREVVFVINEGELLRVRSVAIDGSSFIDEARLKKIVISRGGFFGLKNRFWGNSVNETLFDDDVQRLQLYYRNLGFFDAKINRRVQYDSTGKWIDVNYFVEEGIRYEVTDVQVIGPKYLNAEALKERLDLVAGYPFDRSQMDADVQALRDAYGNEGYFFADIQAQPTLLDEPGKLVMVYKVEEGDRCVCGELRIHIDGDGAHTKMSPIMNRLDGIRPGQLLVRGKVDQAERRLKASGLFIVNPAEGDPPKISVVPEIESNRY